MPNKRTVDLIAESFKDEMTQRRKFDIKDSKGNVIPFNQAGDSYPTIWKNTAQNLQKSRK